jgi:hemerythrin-like domain-containing protein
MTARNPRRIFLGEAVVAGAGVLLFSGRGRAEEGKAAPAPADVNATEDLMREHGVLNRVLLVYEEVVRRIRMSAPPPADSLAAAAGIVQHFIEAYHEKLEEEEVFPLLEKRKQLTDLTATLRTQHLAGRALTGQILAQSTSQSLKIKAVATALATNLEQFIRMYRPHAAREDTVLFPAFHALFTEKEFDALGDKFEEKEHQLLGSGGFEGAVEQVAQLEKELGIYDLNQFTPK